MKTVLVNAKESTQIKVTADTQYVVIVTDYAQEVPVNLDFMFETQGITAEILFLYLVPAKGKLNVMTATHHLVPHTSCVTKVRGVLNSGSQSHYVGKILIDKKAQQTSSFLEDNVLVIGDGTRNVSEPILMIEADDVSASHGATTGRINEEEVYYLRTRGIDRAAAEGLIVDGFILALLDQIKSDDVKKQVVSALKLNLE